MTIKVDEHEEGPSAVMQQKASRDDRGRRDGPRRPPRDDNETGDGTKADSGEAESPAAAEAVSTSDEKQAEVTENE